MKNFSLILVVLIISYIFWFFSSINHPYIAPEWLNTICWLILTSSLIIILYIIYLSGNVSSFNLKKYRGRYNKTRYSQRRANFSTYTLPGFLAMFIVWNIYLIPVIPTRLYANHEFTEEVKVIDVSCYGYSRFSKSRSTEIRYLDNKTNERHTLRYPVNFCKLNPAIHDLGGKTIKLVGRSWLLGTYIDNFYYPTQDIIVTGVIDVNKDKDEVTDAVKQNIQINNKNFSKAYNYR